MRLDCGQQHHFVVSCYFHLATFIDDRLISTVGNYRNKDGNRETIGSGRYYETFVFPTDNDWTRKEGEDEAFEHPDVTNWGELETAHAQTAADATLRHWEMVDRYEEKAMAIPPYGPHKREWYPPNASA